jgi:2-haloacid dehalogenase
MPTEAEAYPGHVRKLADFDALSFDCYGTLIDWESGIAAVLGPWARSHGLDLDEAALLEAYAGAEARAEREHPAEPYPGILARSFRALGARLGARVTEADAQALAGSVPRWPAFPDSSEALAALSYRYQLIILSNVDRRSFAASQEKLGVPFAAVVTAEDVGSYKPAQANFDALLGTLAGLHISGSKLLHVAQSLFHDHVPAKQAGLPTVWINRRHGQPGWGATPPPPAPVQPDWEFPSMAAFAAAACAGPS